MDDVNLRLRLTGEDSGAGKAVDNVDKKVVGLKKTLKTLGAAGAVAGAAAGGLLAKSFADNLDIGHANTKLKNQLRLTEAGAKEAGEISGSVYADNWGSSIDEVNDALRAVGTSMGEVGETSNSEMEEMTKKALALSDTFDVDFRESTQAAGQLMTTGLAKNSEEAFDIITAGLQDTSGRTDDLLDTFNEYSPVFQKLGIGGTTALALLEDGLKAGAMNTDKVADAFKELSLRAIDGSEQSAEGFKLLGLNAKTASAAIGAGGDKAQDMTIKILRSLDSIKDPVKQNAAGVALFGTQWEDTVRGDVLPALARWADASDVVTNASDVMLDRINEDGKTKIEGAKRSFDVWVQSLASADGPLGDVTAGVVAFGGQGLQMAGSLGQVTAGLLAMRGTSVASTAALVAGKVATAASTAAQWLWNAALSANPIGLVILAIAALVAALVWFFTKTEIGRKTFAAAMSGIHSGMEWVRAKASAVTSWITSKWNGMITWFGGLKGRFLSIGNSIFQALVSPGRTAFNQLAGWWNRSVGGFSFTIPSFIPVVGGKSWSIPRIPYLAQGGIVTAPTLAVLGESGPEKVKPLDAYGPDSLTIMISGFIGDEAALMRKISDTMERATGRGYATSYAAANAVGGWS